MDALTEKRLARYQAQLRDKYTQDEIDALGAGGKAFKGADGSYSYPIGDDEDLSNAIRAIGRGNADHGTLRRYIIGRADAQGKSDEIPDNWNSDGSLTDDKTATMSAQERQSYSDTYDLLSSAIASKFEDDDDWAYLLDFTDEWAVFCQNDQKLQVPYTIDGSTVKLGKATPVREITTYEPMEAKSAGSPPARPPATPKRAFSSLVEQPPSHSGEIQVRVEGGDDPNVAHFVGYASTTGVPYEVRDWLGEYSETILPGAFAKTLREQGNIPMLFNHDGVPLASTGSDTSRLSEDSVGLRNEAELDRRDALTNSICVQLQRKVLDKMSFSFKAVKDRWNDAYDDRGVAEAALYDSSIVTYPANPTTSGELVDAMRSALGREGRSLWLAEHEVSVRSALPTLVEKRELPSEAEDVLERALRALAHADEVVCRTRGPHGRARTFLVAHAMLEVRAGKVLSAANQDLLQSALSALSQADKALTGVDDALDQGQAAISQVLGTANPDGDDPDGNSSSGGGDGKGNGTPPGNGNPIAPQDGAGPRSLSPRGLAERREEEIRAIKHGARR